MQTYKFFNLSTVNLMDDKNELIRFNGKSFSRYLRFYPLKGGVNIIVSDYIYDVKSDNKEGESIFNSIN